MLKLLNTLPSILKYLPVSPFKNKLKASIVFPSMPEVMRLNKLGSFSMAQLGQSKSIIGDLIKKKKRI